MEDPGYQLFQVAQELDARERAMDSMERQMDRILEENYDLREQVTNLMAQIQELEEKAALLAQERTELALWISEHQRERGKIREAVLDQGQGS